MGISRVLLSWLFQGKRTLTKDVRRAIERFLRAKPSVPLAAVQDSFIRSNVHKSPKTMETLRERLTPFLDYLAGKGINDPLDISREHIDGFLGEIARGRNGHPLSPASLFGLTKDVRAFVTRYSFRCWGSRAWQTPRLGKADPEKKPGSCTRSCDPHEPGREGLLP